ncbi:MAG: LysM peptidoglycan-binding domain-containing protein [Verrucomicrobiota bacterium]
MKYSSLCLLASSAIFLQSLITPDTHAQPSQASLLQHLEAQDRRIAQLETELAELRAQIGYTTKTATPAPTSPAPTKTTAPARPSPPPAAGGKTYVIQQGETLHAVARKHNVSISQLIAANNLVSPDNIQLGQTLVIPGAHPPAPSQSSTAAPQAPAEPTRTANYTVRRGDTLSSIARAHGSSVSAIITENNMANPNALALGQSLRIPGATKTVAATPSSASSSPASDKNRFPSGYAYYTVIPGDNLYSIARVFGTSQQELERLNNLSPGASIRPNQQIIVPMANYSGPYRTS